ncbi:hypothetical protein D3C77_338990 [compost metagenome]
MMLCMCKMAHGLIRETPLLIQLGIIGDCLLVYGKDNLPILIGRQDFNYSLKKI